MNYKMLDNLEELLREITTVNIITHALDGTLDSWLKSWHIKVFMLIGFLKEWQKD